VNDIPWPLRAGRTILSVLLIVLLGYPMLWAIFAALKSNEQLIANSFGPPWPPQFESLVTVWEGGEFYGYFRNTLLIALISIIGLVPMSVMAAYVFARRRLRHVDALFNIFIIGMMIPPQVLMIPLFRIMVLLDLRNTIWSVILVHLTWTPFGIFLMRTYFLSMPAMLADAAKIDGCSEYGIFWRIYMPLAKPAMVTVAIFNFIWAWNDYIWPLILIQDQAKYTLQQGVMLFQTRWTVDFSMRNAGLVFSFIPPLVFYLVFRRGIQQGLTRGAMKG